MNKERVTQRKGEGNKHEKGGKQSKEGEGYYEAEIRERWKREGREGNWKKVRKKRKGEKIKKRKITMSAHGENERARRARRR